MTLNQTQTKALREVMQTLYILSQDEVKTNPAYRRQEAKLAYEKVRAVVTVKGHYPK